MLRLFASIAALLFLAGICLAAEPLQTFRNCRLVPAAWTDGDSFPVRLEDGREFTVRLYGADCIEVHVADESDARRLSEQRRYFGIAKFGADPKASVELAKAFGQQARQRTAELLKKPFTLHTAFADARGDGKHRRIYAFVNLINGRDLSALLVEEGLARAFGVYRSAPDGQSQSAYRESIRDLEMKAAKQEKGIWAKTDWSLLTEQRQAQRNEEAELELSTTRSKLDPPRPLDPNTAARDELQQLPGVGEVMANRIIEGRPYQSLNDLRRVPGIGEKTLERLRPWLKIGKERSNLVRD